MHGGQRCPGDARDTPVPHEQRFKQLVLAVLGDAELLFLHLGAHRLMTSSMASISCPAVSVVLASPRKSDGDGRCGVRQCFALPLWFLVSLFVRQAETRFAMKPNVSWPDEGAERRVKRGLTVQGRTVSKRPRTVRRVRMAANGARNRPCPPCSRAGAAQSSLPTSPSSGAASLAEAAASSWAVSYCPCGRSSACPSACR